MRLGCRLCLSRLPRFGGAVLVDLDVLLCLPSVHDAGIVRRRGPVLLRVFPYGAPGTDLAVV